MKKFIFTLLLVCTFASAKSQFIEHDISASYGIVTTDQIVDMIKDVFTTIFSFGTYEKDNYDYTGARFLTYKNSVRYRLGLGATVGMDGVRGDLLSNQTKYGTFSTNHYTLAAEADYRWVNTKFFQMYSGFGLGYTLSTDKGEVTTTGESDLLISGHSAFQINPLGMRIGKGFGGFVELGFGYKGLLNFGLSYQFE